MIKRYDFEEGHRGYPCAVECDEGGYVDYDDHASEIARLTAEVERQSNIIDGLTERVDWARDAARTAWNDAIEAAAKDVNGWGELYSTPYGSDIMEDVLWDILALKPSVPSTAPLN